MSTSLSRSRKGLVLRILDWACHFYTPFLNTHLWWENIIFIFLCVLCLCVWAPACVHDHVTWGSVQEPLLIYCSRSFPEMFGGGGWGGGGAHDCWRLNSGLLYVKHMFQDFKHLWVWPKALMKQIKWSVFMNGKDPIQLTYSDICMVGIFYLRCT